MNPEIKTKWIAALRSGKYEQGKNRLRRSDDTYCCLGVLWDIEAGGWFPIEGGDEFATGDCEVATLSSGFMYRVGLCRRDVRNLTDMNDGVGQAPKSFPEIADWIEKNL